MPAIADKTNQVNIRIMLLDLPIGSPRPSTIVESLGIKYREWRPQTLGDQIWLLGVDRTTLPNPLPPYMSLF